MCTNQMKQVCQDANMHQDVGNILEFVVTVTIRMFPLLQPHVVPNFS